MRGMIALLAAAGIFATSVNAEPSLPYFKAGISYTKVRASLLKQGWQPMPVLSAADKGSYADGWPNVPEVVGCGMGATAACRYAWKKGDRIIEIVGHGEGYPQVYASVIECGRLARHPEHPLEVDCIR